MSIGRGGSSALFDGNEDTLNEKRSFVTRFAPSPTGYMHIGNLRTALYSYLIARHHGGSFIVRIEDTDRERLVEGATDVILKTLEDTGICYDEGPVIGGDHGPYIQSERRPIYKQYAEELVARGAAYYCFCTKERLDRLHEEDENGGYDHHCRDLPREEVERNLAAGIPYVIRQKMPTEGVTSYTDEVFGEISTENAELRDQILLKADGYPTYNFAHVVDDYLMGITHVVRGSEYLTSTPKYVLLYDAFGWERPHYVHLPLLMGRGEDGTVSKLSKRHGAVSFQDLVAAGYLPEAILNYIALLGWCPKENENEFFTLSELEELFTIDAVSKSPSVFDYEKLLWFNGEYIRRMEKEAYMATAKRYLPDGIPTNIDCEKLLTLLFGRISCFSEIPGKIGFFCTLPEYDIDLFPNKKNKVTLENAPLLLAGAVEALEGVEGFDNDTLFTVLSQKAEELGVKAGTLFWCIRIAVSGQTVTPGGATEIMEVLGREESLARLASARAKF